VSVRVFRGLNVNFGGNLSSIHDQINLRLKDLSDEEVLVRQSERGTSYPLLRELRHQLHVRIDLQ
jgi:hypothetical protein